MPYSSNDELPEGVKGNLPTEGQTLFRSVFNSAYEGSCKDSQDRDACASKIAWSQVGKKFAKGKDGKWHPKSTAEFSMYINKAVYDKKTGEKRWSAVASDTEDDLYGDNMTLELFSDFIRRIEANEQVPELFQEEYWKGGKPYVSLSHYKHLGKDNPGDVETVYIDGNRFKSKGTFADNPVGDACFRSVCEDLYGGDEPNTENPVRVSIGFLDWAHKHKSNNFMFERKSVDDICPECLKELITGEGKGITYLKGQLVHEALTRVPVNERTVMEVDKSMAEKALTRKDDAESIVGEELADEIEEKAKMVSKALVIKSDMEEDDAETAKEEKAESPALETVEGENVEVVVKESKVKKDEKKSAKKSEDEDMEDEAEDKSKDEEKIKSLISEALKPLTDKLNEYSVVDPEPEAPLAPVAHPLDAAYFEFRARYDEIVSTDASEIEKLTELQTYSNQFAVAIKNSVKTPEPEIEESSEVVLARSIAKAVSEELAPLAQKLDLLIAQNRATSKPATQPVRRSINPALAQKTAVERSQTAQEKKTGFSVDDIVRSNYLKATGQA